MAESSSGDHGDHTGSADTSLSQPSSLTMREENFGINTNYPLAGTNQIINGQLCNCRC